VSANGVLSRIAAGILPRILARLPLDSFGTVFRSAVNARVRSLSPAEGLRFLFSIDETLYPLEGNFAVAYDNGVHTKHRHTRYHDFFIHRIKSGEKVLDVGCGIGALAYDIAQQTGALVVGIDLNERNLDQARTRFSHPNVSYIHGDVLNADLTQRFDSLVLSNLLEHLEHRVDFLRELVEKTNPRQVLLRVPSFERDWRVPLKQELGIDYRLDPTHFTEYTLESFAQEVEAAGLAVTHQECRWGEIWAQAVPEVS
jgi:SAM-dependent methyltransferase